MRLDGRIAVITGAGRGIGRRMVAEFINAGAAGVVAGSRSAGPLEDLQREFGVANLRCVVADVATEAGCAAIIADALAAFGRIDILVNSVGISGPVKLARDLDLAEWESVMATNLTSAFLCAKLALAGMMERRTGVILNISSNAGKQPAAMRIPYAVSKMGLVGLTRTLAQELGPFNIRVNCITPGPVEGERLNTIVGAMSSARKVPAEEMLNELRSASPLRAIANAEDIARMALFLASDHGRHITGQDINVNAGTLMY